MVGLAPAPRDLGGVTPPLQAWLDYADRCGLPCIEEAGRVAETLATEMRLYCELICGQAGLPIGLMVRGEGIAFSERAAALLRAWRMPEDGQAYFAALAEFFEHKRAFLKLEWQWPPGGGTPVSGMSCEHLAAFYFRRRPQVRPLLEYLLQHGVRREVLESVARLAGLLEKDSIHFVAAALIPGGVIQHKLYFSQYITADSRAAVSDRLMRAYEWAGMAAVGRAFVAEIHPMLAPARAETSIFVSVSFTATNLIPSLKIDYPDVPAEVCAALAPASERAGATNAIERLLVATGRTNLSYLGVRLCPSSELRLKYYADFAEDPEWRAARTSDMREAGSV